VRPALTTFSRDLDAIGLRLGRMLLTRLGGDATPMQDIVETRLVLRQSDCPAPRP